jgi:hypothetical protein
VLASADRVFAVLASGRQEAKSSRRVEAGSARLDPPSAAEASDLSPENYRRQNHE